MAGKKTEPSAHIQAVPLPIIYKKVKSTQAKEGDFQGIYYLWETVLIRIRMTAP